MTRVLVCCGAGGVGKTTVSAALGVRLAMDGLRTAVLTIDPARRLADALGLDDLAHEPRLVPIQGAAPLHALVLDPRATFDALVLRSARSPEQARQVMANRYYPYASTRLTGAWEYMAMERLLELAEEDRFDAVVLDTPPTRHALDFLTAPDRLVRVLDHRVVRFLSLARTGAGMDVLRRRSSRVVETLDRLLGSATMGDISEFVSAFEGITDVFAARVRRVRDLLRASGTSFYLVTSPLPAAREEVVEFLGALEDRQFPFGGFIVNRVQALPRHPHAPADAATVAAAPPAGQDPARWRSVVHGVAEVPRTFARWAAADHEAVELLRGLGRGPAWALPEQDGEADDLESLRRISDALAALYPARPSA